MKFLKLSPEEVDAMSDRKKIDDLQPFLDYLAGFKPAEWGKVVLEEGDNPRSVKRRLTQAARHGRGQALRYKATDNPAEILFQVRP